MNASRYKNYRVDTQVAKQRTKDHDALYVAVKAKETR